jgi:hypothetical protein
VAGFIVGIGGTIAGAVVLWVVFGFLWLMLIAWVLGAIPSRPVCKNGCCRPRDYESCYGETKDSGWLMCRCGDRYLFHGRGYRRFMLLNADNSLTPYMRYVPCIGWRKDEGEGTGPCL